MLAFERREKILHQLYLHKKVFVGDLAVMFNVSPETIRRDLDKLELDGIVTKAYGGASLNSHTNEDLSYNSRTTLNTEVKQLIGHKVASLINNDTTIMADTGSTVLGALKELALHKKNITVITNSVMALQELASTNLQLISTGGVLRPHSLSLVGTVATDTLKRYNTDITLLSCKGLSMEHGLTDSNEAESEIKEQMHLQASKIILLADHTKFNNVAFIKLFDIRKVHCLVTNQNPGEEWLRFLKNLSIEVVF